MSLTQFWLRCCDSGRFYIPQVAPHREPGAGEAELAIPIKGPDNSGTIYVVATKHAGKWTFESVEVQIRGRLERIDLLLGRDVFNVWNTIGARVCFGARNGVTDGTRGTGSTHRLR